MKNALYPVLLIVVLLLSACASAGSPTETAGMAASTETAALDPAAANTKPPEPIIPSSDAGDAGAYPAPETTATASAERPAEGTKAPYPAPGQPADEAVEFPDPAGFEWIKAADGFNKPLDLTGDRHGRLLVVQQDGKIRVVEGGMLREAPFLDISRRVTTKANEQGLLGIALHPHYSENGYFYVNYSRARDGGTVIARFSADPRMAQADPASEKILLEVDQPYDNHNGGGLRFGPDGYLYIGLGDGGSGGDPQNNAQNPDSLLGKMLRIDVDNGDPYAIPADNPFSAEGGKAEIWATGLRNPFRFAFDRQTGDLYIGDVGQNQWEEVDFLAAGSPAGLNFGWRFREGAHPYEGEPSSDLQLVEPIFEYSHPTGCSITGGEVYRGSDLPELAGVYLVGDYCSGIVWGLMRGADGAWQSQELFRTGAMITAFGLDDANELYLVNQANGSVLRLSRR